MLDEKSTIEYIRKSKTGDSQAKQILIEENISLVKSIVKRYLGKGVDYDDLFQLACMGFLRAISGFDESFNVRFSTYAVPMIAGEIKRFMRDDGSIKVSRTMKQLAKDMNAYISRYIIDHGSQPSMKILSKKFKMEESEIVFTLGSARMPISIYASSGVEDGDDRELLEILPIKDDQEEMLEKMVLKAAIDKLSDRDKKIIILRYFRDYTQSEVAEKIGVSQVQVSRIESRILKEFKDNLSDNIR